MMTVLGDLLKIDRESRPVLRQTASVATTKVIHLRPTSERPLRTTVLLKTEKTEPYMPVERHFSSWVAWQTKFNEKEKTEKRQFADDFKQKLQSQQAEIQDLVSAGNRKL